MHLGVTPPPKHLMPSKGVHLLFPADRLPLEGAIALKSPAGREGFAIRRWDFVYVGTSDEAHQGDLDRPAADRAAVLDVLKMAQDCFPSLGLKEGDIVSAWAGLRPLIGEEGRSPRDTSPHDEVWRSPEGLLTMDWRPLKPCRASWPGAWAGARRTGRLKLRSTAQSPPATTFPRSPSPTPRSGDRPISGELPASLFGLRP